MGDEKDPRHKRISRKDFLKTSALVAGAAGFGDSEASAAGTAGFGGSGASAAGAAGFDDSSALVAGAVGFGGSGAGAGLLSSTTGFGGWLAATPLSAAGLALSARSEVLGNAASVFFCSAGSAGSPTLAAS